MSANSAPFPSRYELKWAGCSLIFAQVLWLLVGIVFAISHPENYDSSLYDVRSEEDVIALHAILSKKEIRVQTEIITAMYWISFPFYLVAIYGIKKLLLSMFIGTKVEMWIYVLEKAYLFTLLITNIIAPAMTLTIVSFEWSFHEYTADPEVVPTGYYIQLYSLLLVEELYDAVCVADGTFIFFVALVPQFRYFTTDPKFNVLKQGGRGKRCYHVFVVCVVTFLAMAYAVSVFRFAESGFFSLNGGASWLPIVGIIVKFCIGGTIAKVAFTARYDEFKRAFDNPAHGGGIGNSSAGAGGDNYNMETLNVNTPKDDDHL